MAAFQAEDFFEGTSEIDHKMSFLKELEKERWAVENYGLDEEYNYQTDISRLEIKTLAYEMLDNGHDITQLDDSKREEICGAITCNSLDLI